MLKLNKLFHLTAPNADVFEKPIILASGTVIRKYIHHLRE